jgi:hypothetical protein
MSEQEFVVTVPQFNYSTIQNILEINSVLLKILTEYQNNGWVDQPEFAMYFTLLNSSYHKRLGTNLKFLAATGDLLKVFLFPIKVLEKFRSSRLKCRCHSFKIGK